MTDLNALVVFAKVVDANSFSEAARRLKMPVSTVSRRIAELEEQLGVRLLERSTRSLRLTDIGSEILAHARLSVEISGSVDSSIRGRLATVSGKLGIAVPSAFSDALVSPLIRAFQKKYTEVRIDVFVSDRPIDYIDEGIDLAFAVTVSTETSLVARKILDYRYQLVASPAYAQTCVMPQSPQDLAKHRLIAFSCSQPIDAWTFQRINGTEQQTVPIFPFLSMNDAAGLTAALLEGRGIGNLPLIMRPDLLVNGRLVEVMPQWQFPPVELSIVHLGNRHIPPAVRAFKEFALATVPLLLSSRDASPCFDWGQP